MTTPVTSENLKEIQAFLLERYQYSMFILGNMDAHGFRETDAPNSGNVAFITTDGEISGVMMLTRRGNLIVTPDILRPDGYKSFVESAIEWCRDRCEQDQGKLIGGSIGPWEVAEPIWKALGELGLAKPDPFISNEILFSLDSLNGSQDSEVRKLTESDFDSWKECRIQYLIETGLGFDGDEAALKRAFDSVLARAVAWVLVREGQIVAMAGLNARAFDVGQVGGVFTRPEFRRQGLNKKVMQHMTWDLASNENIRRMILFTNEENVSSRALYKSLGYKEIGRYGLIVS